MTGTRGLLLSVMSDEISQDFEHACKVAVELGFTRVELRTAWGRNAMAWTKKHVADAQAILEAHQLKVSAIAGPLFKVDWPSAPVSPQSPREAFGADYGPEQQGEVLIRCLELARTFKAPNIRCFDFWRLKDPARYRPAIAAKLRQVGEAVGRRGLTLVLENEPACNTATAAEATAMLKAVGHPAVRLNWDPGNAAAAGEVPFPDGYRLLPKGSIGHVHVKDAIQAADGHWEWAAVGQGVVDWPGQLSGLVRDGYRGHVVLETHWRGAGSPEESTRISAAGLRQALERAGAA
jgi:L-ribulose-5-phosphate 3-epimerase